MSSYPVGHPYQSVISLPPHHVPYLSIPAYAEPAPYLTSNSAVAPAQSVDECTILFAIAAILLSLSGAYLGGASVNSKWLPETWNWADENTPVGIVTGGAGGILLPYAFYYSNATIGKEGSLVAAGVGWYLGAANANRKWDPKSWDWSNPAMYDSGFRGMQTTLWFVEANSAIVLFVDEQKLQGNVRIAVIACSYFAGFLVAYHYISQYHEGNYVWWEWDRVHEPGTLFALIDGIETGTRLPVGFAEIGLELANRTQRTALGEWEGTLADINPGSVFGAAFIAYLYASDEYKTLNPARWEWGSLALLESILSGIVYGKDLYLVGTDVRNTFRQRHQPMMIGWARSDDVGASKEHWTRWGKWSKRNWPAWFLDFVL